MSKLTKQYQHKHSNSNTDVKTIFQEEKKDLKKLKFYAKGIMKLTTFLAISLLKYLDSSKQFSILYGI